MDSSLLPASPSNMDQIIPDLFISGYAPQSHSLLSIPPFPSAVPHTDPYSFSRPYFCSIFEASNPAFLTGYQIQYVLSIVDSAAWAPKLGDYDWPALSPVQKNLFLKDVRDEEILMHLKPTCDWIKHCVEEEGACVLVHCMQGISSSGAIAVAYGE